jgi:membrane peptidoglycan carboxypeptidase
VVAKVTDLKGNLVYEAETTPERTSFKPENIAGVTYAMTHVVTEGSGSTALELNRPVAGKTGTSNDNKSAWFAGFVPQLATVVGLMQEDENGLTTGITPFGQWSNDEITGSTFPARAWTDYMKVALDGVEVKDFPAYKMPRQSPSPTPSPTQEPTEETAPTEEAPPPDPRADWVTVPADLVGRQVGDAKKALEKLGLGVNTVAVVSNEPESTVVEVAFAGQQVPPGSQITLSVSKGSADGDDDGDGGTTGASPPPAPSSAPSQTADPDKKADPLTPPGTAGKG